MTTNIRQRNRPVQSQPGFFDRIGGLLGSYFESGNPWFSPNSSAGVAAREIEEYKARTGITDPRDPYLSDRLNSIGSSIGVDPSGFGGGLLGTVKRVSPPKNPLIVKHNINPKANMGIVSGEGENLVTLYHGTNKEGIKRIQETGMISADNSGSVFLTPNKNVAKEYGEYVTKVQVPESQLKIDFDLPGGKTLSFDDAKEYGEYDWDDIYDALDDGQSVAVSSNILINKN